MDYEYFNALLKHDLIIEFATGHEHAARLVEVTKLPDVPGQKRAPFSLLFLTDLRDQYFEQGIFTIKNEDEDMSIFLVPVGFDPKTGGVLYQAIFN